MADSKKTLVIIPAYNEETTINKIIMDLKKEGFKDVLVINDGSDDRTAEFSKKAGAKIASHIVNIGLGGALATGLEYAKEKNYKYTITCDGDGQHKASDVKKIHLELTKNTSDFVIGSRYKELKNYPIRLVVNIFSNLLTYVLYGKYVTDAGSGLRGFNKKAIEKINIKTSGYEVSYELIGISKRQNLKVVEIPVSAVYTEHSIKTGQPLSNAFRVLRKLLIS